MVSIIDNYIDLVAYSSVAVEDEPLRYGISTWEKGFKERNPSVFAMVSLRSGMGQIELEREANLFSKISVMVKSVFKVPPIL